MKKIFRTALVAASTLGLFAMATPAQALVADAPEQRRDGGAVTITATTTVVVPEIGCITHPVNYTVTLPDPSKRWDVNLYVYKADGTLRGSGSAGTYQGSPQPSGTIDIQFCGLSYEPGPVTVTSDMTYRDASDVFFQASGPTLTLNVVRNVKSSISLKTKKKGNKVIARSVVKVSTGANSYAIDGGKVKLQKKVGKKWKTIASKTTSITGKVKFAFNPKGRTSIRTKFVGLGEFTAVGSGVAIPGKTSKVVRVR